MRRTDVGRITPRQTEVARLVGEGLSNGEIAERLGLSVTTVRYHLRQVYAVRGVSSRSALAAEVARAMILKVRDTERK